MKVECTRMHTNANGECTRMPMHTNANGCICGNLLCYPGSTPDDFDMINVRSKLYSEKPLRNSLVKWHQKQ